MTRVALLALLLGGCSRLPAARDATEAAVKRFVERPVIELTLNGEDAAKVKALASKGHGTVDLDAVTVGSFIFYFGQPTPRLRAHELCHVDQYRREGLLFAVNYWTENALHGYEFSRYEVECRKVEEEAPN